MYDIRQFKPALYFLLILGMCGYALAAEAPGLWVLAMGGILLNAWLVKTGRFTPMPRFLANGVTILALLVVAYQMRLGGSTPILVIGQFLVLLQLIKLYEQRANRDFAQLLVLSLLLMVAAAINTASLLFGVLLIVYLFISLYCCLLFHLKVEADQAKAAIAVPEEKLNPNTLQQDQRYLPQSMRRLTMLVSTFAIIMAVIVFLFFPRGAGAGIFGQMQFRPSQTLTGFSDQVGFQQVAKITQNQEIVAYVKLWKNDQPVQGAQTLLLRGMTLEVYNGSDNTNGGAWQWSRSPLSHDVPRTMVPGNVEYLATPKGADRWRQEIKLQPTGTNVLFAIAGVSQLKADRKLNLRFSPRDGVVQSVDPLVQRIEYEVVSDGDLGSPSLSESAFEIMRNVSGRGRRTRGYGGDENRESRIDPKIREYTLKPEVSGAGDDGASLAARRARLGMATAIDEQIARNLETHLRSQFAYTLDLTDARNIGSNEDPVVWFLTDPKGKRGHCEYFAGAMTLMCQSIGIPARMVVGFKCDEYNDLTGTYIVRQSHAHAWVEVKTPEGWKTFDPTSGRSIDANANLGMWQRTKQFLDFLEFTWANNVVAYDSDSRENIIQTMETRMTNTAIKSGGVVTGFSDWLNSAQKYFVVQKLLGGLMGLMVFALLVAVVWFLYERWKLRQRAHRIGLDALPPEDQLRLVRQLGFYDDLLRLLEKHQIARPAHLTPMEFCNTLSFLPSEVYDAVRRLTDIFYRIRFGHAEITGGQQRRLAQSIARVGTWLSATNLTSPHKHS